jgi:hypothetical protein
MTDLSPELARLGDALERAAETDLARPRRRRRLIALAAAALALAIPGVAFTAQHFISGEAVAKSLPAGTHMLIGTDPTCTAVEQDVEYRCVLKNPPQPEISDMKGMVEPTVDETKHVNGGCRSLRSDGLEWQCYIGQAAVDQKIVSAGFLGEYAPAPGRG